MVTRILKLLNCVFIFWISENCLGWQDSVDAQEMPLHSRIDSFIDSDRSSIQSVQLPESERLRRLSLDLRMVPPSIEELDEYSKDSSPDRWERWVTRFLQDPMFHERMVDWLDKSLMQRRPNQHVDRVKWIEFLRQSVDSNVPIDKLLRDIVTSTWWNSSERAKQRFFLDRAGDAHAIARDTGRIFFGRDLQCAQCHDHPHISDYLQIDYHGLLAFFAPSNLAEAKFKDEKGTEQKLQLYMEKAPNDAPFESVFDKGVVFRSGPRLLQQREFYDPYLAPDTRYASQQNPESLDGASAPPIQSRRKLLDQLLSDSRKSLSYAWANRIWAMLFGRGIVDPVDMHHAENPPSNPDLLAALADAFQASNLDMKAMIEQIVLSKTYQQSGFLSFESELRDGYLAPKDSEFFSQWFSKSVQLSSDLASLGQKQLNECETLKNDLDQKRANWLEKQKERVVARSDLDKAETAFLDLKKKRDESSATLEKTTKALSDEKGKLQSFQEAAQSLGKAKALTTGDTSDIAQALEIATKRVESVKSGIPKLEMQLAEQTAAKEAAGKALEEDRPKLLGIAAKLSETESKLSQADESFVAARTAHFLANQNHMVSVRSKAECDLIISWLSDCKKVHELEASKPKRIEARESAQIQLATVQTKIRAIEEQLANFDSELAATSNTIRPIQERIAQVISEIKALESTQSSLTATSSLVKNADAIETAKSEVLLAIESRRGQEASWKKDLDNLAMKKAETENRRISVLDSWTKSTSERTLVEEQLQQRQKEVDQFDGELASLQTSCQDSFAKLRSGAERRFLIASQRPLSPEQLGLSILSSTNVFQNYVIAEKTELEKQSPPAADESKESAMERQRSASRRAIDKLRSNIDQFASLYSSGVGQSADEFFATPDQALFVANGGSVYQWSAPSGTNLPAKMVGAEDSGQATMILYRGLLSRPPTDRELDWCKSLFKDLQTADKGKMVQELVWAVLCGAEFRVYP